MQVDVHKEKHKFYNSEKVDYKLAKCYIESNGDNIYNLLVNYFKEKRRSKWAN